MSNSKLYQPPPPPPKPKEAAKDPLMALSKAPTLIAAAKPEELVDLTDDEGLEEWAKGGTRVMPKPLSSSQPPPSVQPTMMSAPLPSFYPVAYSAPPRITQKRSSAAIWLVPLALFILAGGVVAAAGGYYVYKSSEVAAAAAVTDDANTSNVTVPPPPAVTLNATAPEPTVTATSTSTRTLTSTGLRRSEIPTTTTTSTITPVASGGSIRTFAAGNGKPVYVDGRQIGVGGAKLATACGRHLVAVGAGRARSVDIPCNAATITVGTPDGT